MKIYTKSGDRGETGLFGGARIGKDSARVWVYGEIDELNSLLGLARMHPIDEERDALLQRIQSSLFNLGAELAAKPGKDTGVPKVDDENVKALEAAIDAADGELPALQSFVLPGGTPAAAYLHVARTVCRRAERRAVSLMRNEELRPVVLVYLNRLSDLFFVLARLANLRAEVPDVPWEGRRAAGTG